MHFVCPFIKTQVPWLKQGFELQLLFVKFWQVEPENPLAQTHVNWLNDIKLHVPPFWHGLIWQGLNNVWQFKPIVLPLKFYNL